MARTIETWEHKVYGIKVPIKLSSEGYFTAQVDGKKLETKTLEAIRDAVHALVEANNSVAWIPLIEVSASLNDARNGAGDQQYRSHSNFILKYERYWIAQKKDGTWIWCSYWYTEVPGETYFSAEVREKHGNPLERAKNISGEWRPPKGSEPFTLPYHQPQSGASSFSRAKTFLPYSEPLWRALIAVTGKLAELADRLNALMQNEEGRASLIAAAIGPSSPESRLILP